MQRAETPGDIVSSGVRRLFIGFGICAGLNRLCAAAFDYVCWLYV